MSACLFLFVLCMSLYLCMSVYLSHCMFTHVRLLLCHVVCVFVRLCLCCLSVWLCVVQSSRPCVCLLHHVEVIGRDRDGTEGYSHFSSLISAHFMPLILPVLLQCGLRDFSLLRLDWLIDWLIDWLLMLTIAYWRVLCLVLTWVDNDLYCSDILLCCV